MSVDVCHDAWKRVACLYDNTTDTAFGPIFTGIGAGTEAEDFLDWIRDGHAIGRGMHKAIWADGTDPRDWREDSLRRLVEIWRAQYEPETPEPQSLRVPDNYEEGRVQT